MRQGYLAGSFDLLNVGDLDVIGQVRERCDRLVVGVYSDGYVRKLSGRLPVVPLNERAELLRHVRGVAEVLTHNESTDWHKLSDYFTVLASQDDRAGDLAEIVAPARQTSSRELQAALAPLAGAALQRGVA